jgi:hypothetical protein
MGWPLLAASGILSIIAPMEVALGYSLLSSLTLVSGSVNLVALIPLGIYCIKQGAEEQPAMDSGQTLSP